MTGEWGGGAEQIAEELTADVVCARYVPHTRGALERYFGNLGTDPSAVRRIASSLRKSIVEPLSFDAYAIPEVITENNEKVRQRTLQEIDELLSRDLTGEELCAYATTKHDTIKQAQNRWLIANPGVMLEIMSLPLDADARVLGWLEEKYGVRPGHEVIHRHVISAEGRNRLRAYDIAAPYAHWDESYVIDGLHKAAYIIGSNPDNKGIVGLGSWIYNPGNHEQAPDGQPFVAFTFLADDRLSGHRLHLGAARPDNEFRQQYDFATRNLRRAQLAQMGVFQPQVVAVFYPREELLGQFPFEPPASPLRGAGT